MTLHIALEGLDGVGKTTQLEHLKRFFTKKDYEVTICKQPNNDQLIDIMKTHTLTNYQLALLMAADRSMTYEMMKSLKNDYGLGYDIIFWDRSILSSYAYNTDIDVPTKFITDINKYFPEMDLYIVIENDEFLETPDYSKKYNDDVALKYQKLIQGNENIISVPYVKDHPNKVFESIVQTIYDFFPRCNWCGHVFKKTTEHRTYCRKKCSDNAREEQNRINALAHYHRYKEDKAPKLGSYGANLHSHRNKDYEKEHELIKNEKRRLKI